MKAARVCLMTLLAGLCAAWAHGQEPKPAQPAPDKEPGAQDMDPRAKAIRDAYQELLRRERLLVTIKLRNATIGQGVDEFRRQTGWNIVVDYRNIDDNYRIDEFMVENEPARKALEAFADKTELMIEDVSPTLIKLSRPPRLTFNFRDADIKVVIDMIARVSGANIIVAPQVIGMITLSINNVPWNEVLASVVKTLGFTTVRENFGIIRVISPDELLKQLETRSFRLKFIQPPPLYEAKLEENKFISGRPIQPPTQVQDLLNRFVLIDALRTVLSKTAQGQIIGSLTFDPITNSIIVRDTKVVLDRVAEIIAMLDIEPEQVMLDVKFISTTNEDLLTFGVNWQFGSEPGAGVVTSPLRPSSFPGPAGTVTGRVTKLPLGLGNEAPGGGHQFFLTQYDMTMTLRAFKQDRFTRLLQAPTLSVLDNTSATIFVGETIAYAEVRTTTNQFGGLEFSLGEAAKSPVKIGFQLFVIPKIVSDQNKVLLTVIPQNDFLSGTSGTAAVPGFEHFTLAAGTTGAVQSIDLPRISSTAVVTKMIVESNRTAVLGGLVVERSTFEDRGIPVLKDIPLINYLFKQRNDTIRKEHLLIFITPRIVKAGKGPEESLKKQLDMHEAAQRQEQEELRKKEQEKK